MKKIKLTLFIPIAIMLAFLSFGCAKDMGKPSAAAKPAAVETQKQADNVYTGSVTGKSNKAKTVSIQVGQGDAAVTHMLKFDDKTTGLEFAEQGEAAIITWEQRGEDKFATVIKPKLAKLPEGVTEIKVDELFKLVEDKSPITLVDARPPFRYNPAHIPGAINIPVPVLKEKGAAVLPADKNSLIVFYCQGVT
ncbi:MAG TPA: hypothetical protein DDY20_06170 [Desulfobulbaceae bacterium]|jgi:uncharacterized protein with FMN-binding domain|nr:hypothetical protein [Desulfobulbaceae bacterium]